MPFESRAWQLTDNSINASSFKYLVTDAKQETPLGLVSVRLDVIICTKCWVCLEFFEHVYISMDDFEAVKNTQWNTELQLLQTEPDTDKIGAPRPNLGCYLTTRLWNERTSIKRSVIWTHLKQKQFKLTNGNVFCSTTVENALCRCRNTPVVLRLLKRLIALAEDYVYLCDNCGRIKFA